MGKVTEVVCIMKQGKHDELFHLILGQEPGRIPHKMRGHLKHVLSTCDSDVGVCELSCCHCMHTERSRANAAEIKCRECLRQHLSGLLIELISQALDLHNL